MQFTPLLKLNEDKDKFVIDTKFYNDDKVYNGNCAGVYIWGFLHPDDTKRFIPYYVGMTGKSSIFKTIKTRHITKLYSRHSTYRRMTTNYLFGLGMTPFYKDPDFPLYTKTNKINLHQENEWLKTIKDKLEQHLFYLHNKNFFKIIDPSFKSIELEDLPQGWKVKNRDKNFFVEKNIDNFRFIYWNINESEFNESFKWISENSTAQEMENYMEIFEAITKFSLAGKTSGLSITLELLKERMKGINAPSLNSIDANLNYIFKKNTQLQYHTKHDLKNAYMEIPYSPTVKENILANIQLSIFYYYDFVNSPLPPIWTSYEQISEKDLSDLREKGILMKAKDEVNKDDQHCIDLLGMYCPKEERIVLFTTRIKKTAEGLKIEEDLIQQIVLLHEIGHWISHKLTYKEKDWKYDCEWELKKYNKANVNVHEGLAQLYTWWVVDKSPELKAVFDTLTAVQSDPYRVYENFKNSYVKCLIILRNSVSESVTIKEWETFNGWIVPNKSIKDILFDNRGTRTGYKTGILD